MTDNYLEKTVTFYDSKWDTDFFGVKSGKVILHKPLTVDQWYELKTRLIDYQFISIVNQNSEPINNQIIGGVTSAFVADVNIQFVKKIEDLNEMPKNIIINHSFKRNNQLMEIADFQFSKFTEDPELAKRGGNQVYHQWLINSFNKSEKYFAVSIDENGDINGFLLHSYSNNACVIELIAVSKKNTKGGIGTSLFRAVETAAYQRGYSEIRVGTQLRNTGAINFYHKVGCKQVECHQIYHLWQL